jgi:hypothetical protein
VCNVLQYFCDVVVDVVELKMMTMMKKKLFETALQSIEEQEAMQE